MLGFWFISWREMDWNIKKAELVELLLLGEWCVNYCPNFVIQLFVKTKQASKNRKKKRKGQCKQDIVWPVILLLERLRQESHKIEVSLASVMRHLEIQNTVSAIPTKLCSVHWEGKHVSSIKFKEERKNNVATTPGCPWRYPWFASAHFLPAMSE